MFFMDRLLWMNVVCIFYALRLKYRTNNENILIYDYQLRQSYIQCRKGHATII